ncbi:MAG: permease [Deltaproteobacteria bacterium]
MDGGLWILYGEAVKTSAGFFWKSGWAFVLGYFISAMIQAFIPKGKLTPYIGNPRPKSLSLATLFGTISSSCSFAALATARSLLLKGAHFVAAVAFMFASTNLVIELGILILIFLGWQFLAAEVIGGLLLIIISSILIVLTYPETWLKASRKKVEKEAEAEEGDFDWRKRIKSREGWLLVGHLFVMEWKMVWREILIGFTVAGFVAVLVPRYFWQAIFLADIVSNTSGLNFWIVLENSLLAPFVAAATFIGSMGNIPLATVLNANGVLFAGIMGFIYSDLMVPPLVAVNAKYYGWKTAIYIAIIMYVSIVLTAITLHYTFALLDVMPTSARKVEDVAQFKIDYSFWLNSFAVLVTGILIFSHHRYMKIKKMDMKYASEGLSLKKIATYLALLILIGGFLVFLLN